MSISYFFEKKVTIDRHKQNKNDHDCILLFLKEHVSYWKNKMTGLSLDTTNKSQLIHLYLYAVG